VIDVVEGEDHRVQYLPDYWYRPEFWLGLSLAGSAQLAVFPIAYSAAYASSWAMFAWLARKTFRPLILYESAMSTQKSFTRVGHTIGAGPYWAATGDAGSGGAMPIVTGNFASDDPFGLKKWWESL